MWDTSPDRLPDRLPDQVPGQAQSHLTHDLPCARCGHAVHTYLACSDTCSCAPCVMPGLTR